MWSLSPVSTQTETRLCWMGVPTSSLAPISVSASTISPVYRPSRVSKLLPCVKTVSRPDSTAVQLHHTELSGRDAGVIGLAGLHARAHVGPVRLSGAPASSTESANRSFHGSGEQDAPRENRPHQNERAPSKQAFPSHVRIFPSLLSVRRFRGRRTRT